MHDTYDGKMKYIIHAGKTNSGKTYNSIKRLREFGTGVYLAPLRLLAWEIYDSLNSEGFRCNLITGEEQLIHNGAKMTASTIEMLDCSKDHGVVIIDEAFMIGDRDRGKSWLKAILEVRAEEVHIITNHEALGLISNILSLSEKEYEVKQYEMLQKFTFPARHFQYEKKMPPRGVFVTFSRKGVLMNKNMLEKMGKTVSVLYGNLPPEIKKKQIEDFISGKSEFLVSTDVIGMGLNIPCDYIVFLETEKFDGQTNRGLTPIEIRQIAGRTGRYKLTENAFVSAMSKNKLEYVKTNYNKPYIIDKAYCGLDYNYFSNFPETTLLRDRIKTFKKSFPIPVKLRHIVFRENIETYLELCPLLENKKIELKEKWQLLTSPVKYNNKSYFEKCIYEYELYKKISPPYVNKDIIDTDSLESFISEIELYLNITRHFNHNITEKEEILKTKDYLIDKLIKILADKNASSKKKCKLCPEMLDINYSYGYCQSCYKNKIRAQYHDYSDAWEY